MAGGYRFLDHMTDAVIEAHGTTLEEAFEQAAKGLNDTMIDLSGVRPEREIRIEASGHDLESLLFDWLDKVMLALVADGIVMSEFLAKNATLVLAIGIVMIWNFFINRYWTYNDVE